MTSDPLEILGNATDAEGLQIGEHCIDSVEYAPKAGGEGQSDTRDLNVSDGNRQPVGAAHAVVRLPPQTAASLRVAIGRHVNRPTYGFPWAR